VLGPEPEPYKAKYPVASPVRIRESSDLAEFKRTWALHHRLSDEQMSLAGERRIVKTVLYYHGGDPLYELENASGLWHEQCLDVAPAA